MKFYKTISKYYDELFPLSEEKFSFISKNIGTLISVLPKNQREPEHNIQILDIGCSTGDLLMRLYPNFPDSIQCIGIDLDAGMIRSASSKAKSSGVKGAVRFFEMDMREIEIFFDNDIAAIFSLGNTLVHLVNSVEIIKFFKAVYSRLVNNGIFIFQIINYDHILKNNIRDFPETESPRTFFKRKYDFSTAPIPEKSREYGNKSEPPEDHEKSEFIGTISFKRELTDKRTGYIYKNKISLYPLLSGSALEMLKEAGFKEIKLYGSYNGEEYTADSPGLIAVAKKIELGDNGA